MRFIEHIKQAVKVLIFNNILISLAALSQMALTYLLLGLPKKTPLLMVEFSSTLLFYNFALYLSLPKSNHPTPFARTNWILKNRAFFIGISLLAIIVFGYCFLIVDRSSQIFLIIIGLFSVLYAYPVFKFKGLRINFRSLPYLKVFFITLIWVMSTFWLPILDSHSTGEIGATHNLWIRSVHRFLFLLICTLPFDLRDSKADKHYGIKTFSTLLGTKNSILLINGLLILHGILSFYLDINISTLVALLFVDAIVFTIFNLWIEKRKQYLLYYLMDFFLILQFVIVWIFNYSYH